MNETANKILNALDRALTGPEPTKLAGNRFEAPRINLTPLALSSVIGGLKAELATKGEIAELKDLARRWFTTLALENNHTQQHAKTAYLKQGEDLAATIAETGKAPSVSSIQSQADYEADFRAIVEACKLVRRRINAKGIASTAKIYSRVAQAAEDKLAVMHRTESAQCDAVGLPFSPSADYLVHDAVARWARNLANPDSHHSSDGNPGTMLVNLGIKL